MLKNFRVFPIYMLLLIVFSSCKKENPVEPNPPISKTPYIELKSVSPSTVKQFQDSIVFQVFYRDGDGDLGFESKDSMSLFITDNRKNLTESFHIQPLAPISSSIVIEGILKIVLPHTILLDGNQNETTTYTLQIKDRAGNFSNKPTSQNIVVTP